MALRRVNDIRRHRAGDHIELPAVIARVSGEKMITQSHVPPARAGCLLYGTLLHLHLTVTITLIDIN